MCAVNYRRPQIVLINNTTNMTNEKSCLDCITGPVQPFTFRGLFLGCWFWNGLEPKLSRPQRQNVTRCQQLCRLRDNVHWMISRCLFDEFSFFAMKYARVMCFTCGLTKYIKLWHWTLTSPFHFGFPVHFVLFMTRTRGVGPHFSLWEVDPAKSWAHMTRSMPL